MDAALARLGDIRCELADLTLSAPVTTRLPPGLPARARQRTEWRAERAPAGSEIIFTGGLNPTVAGHTGQAVGLAQDSSMAECAFAAVGRSGFSPTDGAVAGERIQRVLQGRADASGRSLADVTADALSIQSLKRFTDPDDIAALALSLASDSTKSITGQTIPIDGGSQAAQ
ncbi:SDR family oxidoreductase [Streptomyces sp. NPDC056188]|uniref:SDR family oxidoreductase n=1 Tax=Streptomyces sp. NPDC056188 TaxID=3345740 RepID=UPI0035DFEDC0